MAIVSAVLYWLSGILLVLALPAVIWQAVVGIVGQFGRRNPLPTAEKRYRFAVLICARHEEAVIGQLLDSLNQQTYPRELYDIFVVADNCTRDDTAGVARRHGAIVYERFNQKEVGKGYALRWAVERLREDYPDRYDAVCVFDADNLAIPGFLEKMNQGLCAGADIVEGYRDTKNPGDSWISGGYAIYWMLLTRFFHRARCNLGMSGMVCGTGFAFKMEVLGPEGWNTQTITEDCEFSILQIAAGRKIRLADEAVFYDEQPVTFSVSLRQRFRWLVGAVQITRCCMQPVLRGVKARHKGSLDMLLYLLIVPSMALLLVSGVLSLLSMLMVPGVGFWALVVLAGSLVLTYIFTAGIGMITVVLERKSLKLFAKAILLFPVFMFPMAFLAAAAFLHPRTEWKPIAHSRAQTIGDVMKP